MSTPIQAPPLPESPYPGIKSFRYIDQQIFSSREDETWNLLSNVLIYRGVLLYGDSGSGKSSLINAGLIPAALKENLISNRLRIQPQSGKEIKIERIPIESEDTPPYLPSVLVTKNSDEDKLLNIEISLDDFYERLKKLERPASGEPRPLLIFDQFEEFVTLFEEAQRGGEIPDANVAQRQAADVHQAILKILTRLIEDEGLPVKVLFVFREDYFAKLSPLFEACPELLNQCVRLLSPRVEEAEEIIRAPFVNDELKRRFTKKLLGSRNEISAELAETVAKQLQERSDTGFINLSELQIVCWKLWESADPVKYFDDKDRDIQKVVEDYWADVLKKLGDLYDPAIALLGHMVTSSNTRNIISEPDLKTREKDLKPTQIDAALKALVERKLVRREPRNKIYFYEIASEFLVPWIEQKKAARLAELRARELAAEAENKLKQSETQKRKLWIGASVLGLFLLVAIGLAIYSAYLHRVAEGLLVTSASDQRALQREKDWSGNIIRLLNQLTSQDANVRVDGVKGLVAMDQRQDLPRELVPVVLAVSSKDDNQEVSKAASYFFSLAAREANTDLTVSILKSAESNTTLADANNLAPRIYIQVASDRQRGRADKIAGELKNNGFTVPRLELVDSRHAPKTNQLRYYKSTDEAQEPADPNVDKILQIITAKDGPKWSKVALPASFKAGSGPGHFEVWFAKDALANDGTLVLEFEDEDGNEIQPKTFRVNLTSEGQNVLRTKNSSSVAAPAGKYRLTIQVPNYKAFQTGVEITGGHEVVQKVTLRNK